MRPSIRCARDQETGLWTAVGDDGTRKETRTAETADEANARFHLLHCPVADYPAFDDQRYDGIKASPPEGCTVDNFEGHFGLRCERPGATLLNAVAEVCAEVRVRYRLFMTDLGIEKLDEWSEDGTDGWGAEIVGQLLLMAADRGPRLGYSADDLVRFLRTASGPADGP